MMAFGFDVEQAIADLQAVQAKWPEYEGLPLKLSRLKLEVATKTEEAGRLKAESKVVEAQLAKEKAKNLAQYNAEMERMGEELERGRK